MQSVMRHGKMIKAHHTIITRIIQQQHLPYPGLFGSNLSQPSSSMQMMENSTIQIEPFHQSRDLGELVRETLLM